VQADILSYVYLVNDSYLRYTILCMVKSQKFDDIQLQKYWDDAFIKNVQSLFTMIERRTCTADLSNELLIMLDSRVRPVVT
jgi:hypothetical protein